MSERTDADLIREALAPNGYISDLHQHYIDEAHRALDRLVAERDRLAEALAELTGHCEAVAPE